VKTAVLLLRYLQRLVRGLAILALGWMVVLAFSQVVLRWVFDRSLTWSGLQLQQLVLVVALLGGLIASVESRHIRIDLIEHYLHGKAKRGAQAAIACFSGAGALYLGYISIDFVRFERSTGSILRGFFFGLTIPNWYIELIIPVCFGLMALFFFASAFVPDWRIRDEAERTS